MNLFNYNPETREYIGQSIAGDDPLVPGNNLMLVNATTTPPPETDEGEVAVYTDQGWEVVAIKQESSADPVITVAGAVTMKQIQLAELSNILQERNFSFNGHAFYADQWATKTLNSCLSVSLALGLSDTDPVRVPYPLLTGYWFTADADASGNRIAIPFTAGDIKHAVTALYDRNGLIWGAQMIHNATVEAMAAEGATAEEILAYDHTAGWPV